MIMSQKPIEEDNTQQGARQAASAAAEDGCDRVGVARHHDTVIHSSKGGARRCIGTWIRCECGREGTSDEIRKEE